jgi:hypothetical protein
VPGWRANKTKKRGQGGTKGGYIESYYIRSCPEYDPEPKRDIPEEREAVKGSNMTSTR